MSVLSQITDGREAWSAFSEGVSAVFEGNASAAPTVAVVVGLAAAAVVVMWLNVRFARWLARRLWGGGPREG